MTAQTTPDGLRYPDDYQQPADTPAVMKELADSTQAALVARAAAAAAADASIRADMTAALGNTVGWHTAGNLLTPEATIGVTLYEFGALAAGQIKDTYITIQSGTYVLVSVQHPSTYVIAVANLTEATTVQVRVRNSGPADLSGVKVHLLFVNPKG